MSWRVVLISSRAKLDYKMDYLVIRTNETTKRIHLSEISILMVESTAVSLTAYLLCELTKWKIDIIFCDEKRMPYGMLQPLYGSYDSSAKLRTQIKWTESIKNNVWKEIIKAKIRGQIFILEKYHKPESIMLKTYLSEVVPGDTTNREGHAAKVYFNAIFGMSFSRGQDNSVNSALNYGYSIILSAVAREITASGYTTQLGVFHNNVFNKLNLASDFIEPFRTFIDLEVLEMNPTEFGHNEKVRLVQVLNREVIIDERKTNLINAVRIFCKSVFDSIENEGLDRIKFPEYEL